MKTLTIGDLKARIPIIQGGMGVGISLSGLASAVANEGGIGVISAAGLGLLYKKLSPNYTEAGNLGLAAEIRKAREKAKGIIGVNVMVALSDFAELVKTSIAEKVDIIFSGAGLPLDLPSFLKKDSVTKLVPIVSSTRAVRIICEKWKANYDYLPDAIVRVDYVGGIPQGWVEGLTVAAVACLIYAIVVFIRILCGKYDEQKLPDITFELVDMTPETPADPETTPEENPEAAAEPETAPEETPEAKTEAETPAEPEAPETPAEPEAPETPAEPEKSDETEDTPDA